MDVMVWVILQVLLLPALVVGRRRRTLKKAFSYTRSMSAKMWKLMIGGGCRQISIPMGQCVMSVTTVDRG